MKTPFLKLLLLIAFSFQANGQPVPPISNLQNPGRGLYVSNFYIPQTISATAITVDQSSIIGNPLNAQALLTYCKENHITHIVLYDVRLILADMINGSGNPRFLSGGQTLETAFCDFITLARANCITNIGVTGSRTGFFDDLRSGGGPGTAPIVITNTEQRNALGPDILNLFETQYYPTDSLFEFSEYLKYYARIFSIFPTALGGGGTPCFHDLIDSYVVELEFWRTIPINPTYPNCSWDYNQDRYLRFQFLLSYIDNLRDVYNGSGTGHYIYNEVYLGNLDDWHNEFTAQGGACVQTPVPDPGDNDHHQAIADFIDGYYTAGSGTTKECDRIFASYYCPTTNDPAKMYNDNQCRDEDFYLERFLDFCDPLWVSPLPLNNIPQTDYHPLFHAGFVGNWFNSTTNNIFIAEKDFYDDWFADLNVSVRSTRGNQIDPGGVQWYGSDFLVQYPYSGAPVIPDYIAKSRTFLATPVPNTNNIIYTYQGPLESGTKWTFKIDGTICVSGITGIYNPTTNPIGSFVNLSGCGTGLSTGPHTASLTLEYEYPTGCSYTYTQTDIVTPNFYITKTENNTITYSGSPVTFTVTMTNNTGAVANVVLTDALPPDFVLQGASITLKKGSNTTYPGTSFTPGLAIQINPGSDNVLTYSGYFTEYGTCAYNTNTITMTPTVGTPVSSNVCVLVKWACPMIVYGHTNCNDPSVASMNIGIHIPIQNVERVSLYLYYPDFVHSPLGAAGGYLTNSSQITSSFPLILSGSLGGCYVGPEMYSGYTDPDGVAYNKVLVDIMFSSPITSPQPNLFATLLFNYYDTPPLSVRIPNKNTFLCWASSPTKLPVTASKNFSDIYLSTTPTIMRLLTQASQVYFHGCADAPYLNKSFTITQPSCTNPGRITVAADNTGNPSNTIHIWDFGDIRSTPLKGGQLAMEWNYLENYTNTDGVIQGPLSPGTYTITHTVISDGVFNEETQTVFIGPGCCDAEVKIDEGKKSTSEMGITNFGSETVEIEGHFEIDNNFSFNGTTVIMEPGSSITIKNGQNVVMQGAHFYGCSAMWEGIRMEGDTYLEAVSTEFNDANIAIFLENNSNAYLKECLFIENVIGVSNGGNEVDEMNYNGCVFDGNTFKTTGHFKPDYTGQPTHGTYGLAGIRFYDLAGNIGSDKYNSNHFRSLNDGIVLDRCGIIVENNSFENIHSETGDGEESISKGAAVNARGGRGFFTVTVNPFNAQSEEFPTIKNCDYGVNTNGIGAGVYNVVMREVKTGVYATRAANSLKVKAVGNDISATNYGIHYINNEGANLMLAHNNVIYFTGATPDGMTYGINCEESGTGLCNFVASGNVITSDGGLSGITVSGTNSAKILSNLIYSTRPNAITDGFEGISVLGAESNLTSCNTVSGSMHDPSYLTVGYVQSVSSKCLLHCNSVDNTSYGFGYYGPNTDADFKDNSMSNNVTGLHLNSNAVIGEQVRGGNHWYGPCDDGVGYTDGAENLNTVGQYYSKFYTNAGSSIFTPSSPSFNIGWFTHDAGIPFVCNLSQECTVLGDDGEEITYLDRAIANGSINTYDFLPESKSMVKMHLYEKLKDDPSLLSDAALQNFYTTLNTSPVKKLTEVKEGMRSLKHYDQLFANNMRMADSLIKVLNDSIDILDSTGVKTGFTTSLQNQKKSLSIRINTLENTIKTMIHQREIANSGDKALVEGANDLITSNEIPEQNKKIMNELHLKTDNGERNIYTATQENDLESVAFQCPYSGGEAVYRARVLYKLLHPTATFNDAANCLTQGIYRQVQKKDDLKQQGLLGMFRIQPNPTRDYATLSFKSFDEIGCKMQIYDLSGKMITQYDLPCDQGTFNFSTSELAPGFYLVKVVSGTNLIGISKLGIVK